MSDDLCNPMACECGHGQIWHQDRRGCGYSGYGEGKCACALMFHQVFERIIAARVAAVEAERDEWREKAQNWDETDRLAQVNLMAERDEVRARLDAVLAAVESEMRGEWANRHHVNGWAVVRVNDLRAAVAVARGDS